MVYNHYLPWRYGLVIRRKIVFGTNKSRVKRMARARKKASIPLVLCECHGAAKAKSSSLSFFVHLRARRRIQHHR